MQFTTLFAVVASIATLAAAAPGYPHEGGSNNNGHKARRCNAGSHAACCNGDEGIAVLGSQCTLLSVLGACQSNNVQCCKTTQNGEINLINLCAPIDVL